MLRLKIGCNVIPDDREDVFDVLLAGSEEVGSALIREPVPTIFLVRENGVVGISFPELFPVLVGVVRYHCHRTSIDGLQLFRQAPCDCRTPRPHLLTLAPLTAFPSREYSFSLRTVNGQPGSSSWLISGVSLCAGAWSGTAGDAGYNSPRSPARAASPMGGTLIGAVRGYGLVVPFSDGRDSRWFQSLRVLKLL